MARIKRKDLHVDFKSLTFESALENEGADCAVKAVALACNVSYKEAKERLASMGRKKGCGTHRYITRSAIASFGYAIKEWSSFEKMDMIKSYPSPHHNLHSITSHHPRRFPKAWAKAKDKTLLMFSRNHVLAVKGGEVLDWSVNSALPIRDIWEVERLERRVMVLED